MFKKTMLNVKQNDEIQNKTIAIFSVRRGLLAMNYLFNINRKKLNIFKRQC